ncbi:MAG: YdcF family protein [Sphingobacteriaceae bacterium]|nr:YdcF family protein [Sphingobacteriaceae bacterium]
MKFWSLILVVLLFNNCAILNPVRKSPYKLYMANIKDQPFDAIIVPGVPYNAKKWSDVMRLRILWSKFLFEKGYTKNIIYSGGAVHSQFIESRIMGLFAEAFGIPKAYIFTEEKAEHSTENVYYSYYLAKAQGFKNIALATDPYQTSNLYSYIKKQKLDIKLLPLLLDTVLIMDRTEPKINPEPARMSDTAFNSLKKREGFFKRLRGTMGKNIEYTEEDKIRRETKAN